MYQALANLLDNYSENRILLDKEALEEIARLLIERKNKLGAYIKDINVLSEERAKTFATYNIEDKIINFYLEYSYRLLAKKYGPNEYRQKNEILMQTMLHEIRHANQNLQAFSVGNSLEQSIIRASILIQVNEDYYLRNSEICPLERLAEIDSYLQMMLVVRKSSINNEMYYFTKANSILHSGYPKRFKDSPTEKYIRNGIIDSYFSFSKSKLREIKKMFLLEERLRLGVNVSREEFKKELNPDETLRRLRK